MVNIYCNFLGTKNGTIRFCFLPDKSELFLKKLGNIKLNYHTLWIGLPFGPPSSAEWIWFIIIESDGGSEARFMVWAVKWEIQSFTTYPTVYFLQIFTMTGRLLMFLLLCVSKAIHM